MATTEIKHEEERVNRPACAACKHQRKKCISGKCILHEIFPAAEHEEFEAVHKLFGISNITKLMHELNSSEERFEAAKALKYEAMLWKNDPVRGASGEISRLTRELEKSKENNKRLWKVVQTLRGYMMSSSASSDGTGNTQQNSVLVNGNCVVFQNNGVFANNGDMGLENGAPHSQALIRNQEIVPPDGVERQHQNFQNQEIRPPYLLERQFSNFQANQEVQGLEGMKLQHQNLQNQEIGENQQPRATQGIEVQHQIFPDQEMRGTEGIEVQHQSFPDQEIRAHHGLGMERQHQHFLNLSHNNIRFN